MVRVTMSQVLGQTQLALVQRGAQAAKLQEDLSSGVRIRRPSDDPWGQALVLQQRRQSQQMETRLQVLADARARLQQGSQVVQSAQDLFVRAKSIALAGVQSTEPSERRALAAQVDRLLETLSGLARTEHDGRPLFVGLGGDVAGAGASYDSSAADRGVRLGDGSWLTYGDSAQGVFQPAERGPVLVTGNTGTAAGAGTSTARGVQELQVRHTATLIAPGSGVQTGLSSAARDTILGPAGAHSLVVIDTSGTGAWGTVALNGGPAVAFTSADADLAVTGPRGELVHLDFTTVAPGFSGTIALSGEGTLSLDGGQTTTALDFSTAQGVVDARGEIAYLDTTSTRQTGDELVEFTATLDAFAVLARLRDELRDESLDSSTRAAQLSRRLGDLDSISDHLLSVLGEQSATLEQIDRLTARAEDVQLQSQQVLAETENTDYAAAVLALQEQQTWMQFSLATITRLFDVSVLNYL